MASKVRLYVDHPLSAGQTVPLTEAQAHYLFGVMRLGAGAVLSLFNGRDGAWDAGVATVGKRGGDLVAQAQTQTQGAPPDLWLLFAPVKKARTDFIVEKAVEMGAARILPVLTDFTNAERVRVDKTAAHVREAAEQCGATWLPQVAEPARLDRTLAGWDGTRRLMWCDETRAGLPARVTGDPGQSPGPWAILIGPEGGFSDAERARLAALPFTHPVSLGPRILRADTAAVAALALWQAELGDWR
jgi:16S rRNA (uracil1498-N3)-methyltransferase